MSELENEKNRVTLVKDTSNRKALNATSKNSAAIKNLIQKYGAEYLKEKIECLGDADKKMIKMFLGIDGSCYLQKEIASQFNCSKSYVCVRIRRIIEKLSSTEYENEFSREIGVSSELKDLYSEFFQYEKDDVDLARSKLSSREQEILNCYFGLGVRKRSLKEISEKVGLSEKTIYLAIERSIIKIAMLLKNNDLNLEELRRVMICNNAKVDLGRQRIQDAFKVREKFYENFECYTREQVNNVFVLLSEKEQKVLALNYCLNGGECLLAEEVAAQFGVSKKFLYNIIYKATEKMKRYLDDGLGNRSFGRIEKTKNDYSNKCSTRR